MSTAPHPVNPASPRPHTPSRPTTPTPKPTPSKLRDDVWFRLGLAAGVVGALLLVTHYFEPFLMLGALPTRRWRAAAGSLVTPVGGYGGGVKRAAGAAAPRL